MRTKNYLGGNSDGLDDDVPGECFLQDIHCQTCDGPWSTGALTNKKKNLCKKISNCPYFLTAAKAVLLSTLQHNTVLESSAPSVAKNCLRVHNSRMLMWLCFHNSGTVSENIEFFQYHPYPLREASVSTDSTYIPSVEIGRKDSSDNWVTTCNSFTSLAESVTDLL